MTRSRSGVPHVPGEHGMIDDRALGESVSRYLAAVYGRAEDARDVTQEAFLRLHLALTAPGDPIKNREAWVFTVARRLMVDRIRRARTEAGRCCAYSPDVAEAVHDPAESAEELLADRQRLVALQHAIRSLTGLERRCLEARARGLKLRQIASIVGLDLRRVAEIINRAIQTLQGHVAVGRMPRARTGGTDSLCSSLNIHPWRL